MELTAKVLALYNEIVENDLLEDRREYDVAELQSSYQIGIGEALELHHIIQANFTAETPTLPNEMFESIKTIVSYPGMQVKRALCEYIEESDFQGWEGYTAADIGSIDAFLKDLALAMVSAEDFEGMGENDCNDAIYGIRKD
jgi:hypothetical protein